MRRRAEAAFERDGAQRIQRPPQQRARFGEAQIEIEGLRRRADVLAEEPLDLSDRDVGAARQFPQLQRLIERPFHERDHLDELRALDAIARMQIETLLLLLRPHLRMNELLGNREGELAAAYLTDEMHHHVERGCATGAGEYLAVDDVEILCDLEVRIARAKGLEVFPMDRAAPSGEHSGCGEEEGAAADGADDRAVTRESPQLMVYRDAVLDLGRLEAGADDEGVDLAELGKRPLGRDGNPVARLHGGAVRRDQVPFEKRRPAQAVGGAQRLDAGCKRHHREAGNEQERYSNWLTGGSERHRASFPAGAMPVRCANVARSARGGGGLEAGKMSSHALF